MSLTAYNWARDLRTLKSSTLKAILKELAGFENGTGEAWTDIPTLVRFTDLDRKTVIAGLQELVKRGVLADTGKRAGRTRQITVYRLVGFDPDFARTQREEEAGKGPDIGTVPSSLPNATAGGAQVADSVGNSGDETRTAGQEWKESQKRNSSENGTVPISAGKSPVFSGKGSQKRDTNGSNGTNHSDARAHAPRGARAAPDPEPSQPDPEIARRHLREDVLRQFIDEAAVYYPQLRNKPLSEFPEGLQLLIVDRAQPIVHEFDGATRGSEQHAEAVTKAKSLSAAIIRRYHSARGAQHD